MAAGVTYEDFSRNIRGAVEQQVMNLLQEGAEMVRDSIVRRMRTSNPSGHWYWNPATQSYYQASAPGEPPAVRTGQYLESWKVQPPVRQGGMIVAGAYSDHMFDGHEAWRVLEKGAPRAGIAPRPHIRPALDEVEPELRSRVRSGRLGTFGP